MVGQNTFRPAYILEEGAYPPEVLSRYDPQTYWSVMETLRFEYSREKPPEYLLFTKIRVKDIVDTDDFVSTLLKYYRIGWDQFEQMVRRGEVSQEDLESLFVGVAHRSLDEILRKLRSDFERVERAEQWLKKDGIYYPPVLDQDLYVVDGAHRVVALANLGADEIYCWIIPIEEPEANPPKPDKNILTIKDNPKYGWCEMPELELKERRGKEEEKLWPPIEIGTLSEEEAEAIEEVTSEPIEVEEAMPPKVRHLITSALATIDLLGQQFHEDLGGYLIGRPIPGGGMILYIPEEVVHEVGYLPYSPETPEEMKEAVDRFMKAPWFSSWAKAFYGISPEEVEKMPEGPVKDVLMNAMRRLAERVYGKMAELT